MSERGHLPFTRARVPIHLRARAEASLGRAAACARRLFRDRHRPARAIRWATAWAHSSCCRRHRHRARLPQERCPSPQGPAQWSPSLSDRDRRARAEARGRAPARQRARCGVHNTVSTNRSRMLSCATACVRPAWSAQEMVSTSQVPRGLSSAAESSEARPRPPCRGPAGVASVGAFERARQRVSAALE